MVQKIITMLVDDIDGATIAEGAGETIMFGIDGMAYEIDLTRANALSLREALAPFVAAGRAIKGRSAKTGVRAPAGERIAELAAIREWATTNNYPAPSRGRIPAATIAAYESSSNKRT